MSEQSNSSRLRKTTVESSRQLEIILQERENKTQKRKSNKSAIVSETEVVTPHSKEIDEVVDLADHSEYSVETEQNIEIEDPSVDPLAGLTPGSSRRLRSVSTELNRFECGDLSSLSPDRVGLITHSVSDVHH